MRPRAYAAVPRLARLGGIYLRRLTIGLLAAAALAVQASERQGTWNDGRQKAVANHAAFRGSRVVEVPGAK